MSQNAYKSITNSVVKFSEYLLCNEIGWPRFLRHPVYYIGESEWLSVKYRRSAQHDDVGAGASKPPDEQHDLPGAGQ